MQYPAVTSGSVHIVVPTRPHFTRDRKVVRGERTLRNGSVSSFPNERDHLGSEALHLLQLRAALEEQ